MRTDANRMRIVNLIFALILTACGCAAARKRVVKVEHAVVKNERQLERINDSFDQSERDIFRMRVAVFELVDRGRVATQQLEIAAREFQMASVNHRLASHEFIRAAASYQDAADTYRQVASMIIQVASSERFLNALCKRPTGLDRYRSFLRAYGVKLDDRGIEQLIPRMLGKQDIVPNETILELPLPVMNVLFKDAADILLCGK